MSRLRTVFVTLITLLCLSLSISVVADDKRILLVSEEWEDATNSDGTGVYWELLREVYEAAGYKVEHMTVPYARAVAMVLAGDADAWVGSYMDEEDDALYPTWHFDADIVMAAFRSDKMPDFKGQASLSGKRVGWVRGYSYDEYLKVDVEKTQLNNRESGLSMVLGGRLDAVLDDAEELALALENIKADAGPLKKVKLMQLPLYLAFHDSERSKTLIKVFDQGFEPLVKSGRVQELFDKWDYGEYTGMEDEAAE